MLHKQAYFIRRIVAPNNQDSYSQEREKLSMEGVISDRMLSISFIAPALTRLPCRSIVEQPPCRSWEISNPTLIEVYTKAMDLVTNPPGRVIGIFSYQLLTCSSFLLSSNVLLVW